MGIQNLLRFLKPFIKPVHIKKYAGKRVGIDAYSWLHKGAYSCSMELCLNAQTEAARRYLKYFMHHINLLRHYKITPVVVFDGGNMPCKAGTEDDRHRRRESNLELAKEQLKQGNVSAAVELFQRAVRITPTMAHQLIQILRSESVDFVVAPYEADAQLAYLSTLHADEGGIAAVITEDSDLIAYGCPEIIFKMDRYGNAEEFVMEKVFSTAVDGLSFCKFDKELFVGMCVLSGCDFLPSIPGIGNKRAYTLVSKYRNLDRVLSTLKFDKRYQMPEDYVECFRKAVAVFHHARIYDAKLKTLKPLKPLEQKHLEYLNEDLDLLGPELPSSVAAAIAEGLLNPITMEAFDHFPTAEKHFDNVTIPTLDCSQIDEFQMLSTDESQGASTQENCITIFQAHPTSNIKKASKEEIVFNEKKYMKEALALGKLTAPRKNPVLVQEVERRHVPDNNPFKRKLDNVKKELPDNPFKKAKLASCTKGEHSTEQISVLTAAETSVVNLCSSPESQDSVKSKLDEKATIGKSKSQKLKADNDKSTGKRLSGIFKFFHRL